VEKEKLELIDKFKRELKKEKEAWMASEKVRKEKWEHDKIQEIKMGTVQQLQPTIEQLIIKNKDELRK
jgi:5-azacytidine-induced protein 1